MQSKKFTDKGDKFCCPEFMTCFKDYKENFEEISKCCPDFCDSKESSSIMKKMMETLFDPKSGDVNDREKDKTKS